MKLKIEVTAQDIKRHGKNVMSNDKCPNAIAVRRALRKAGVRNVAVSSGHTFVRLSTKQDEAGKMFDYPKQAILLQSALMGGGITPKPIKYALDIPASALGRRG